jgi:hypothetical protein
MSYALAALCLALIGALCWFFWMHLRAAADWQEEREALIERIQHPESAPTTFAATPSVHREPPEDATELAHVGTTVPDYVHLKRKDYAHIGAVVPDGAIAGDQDGVVR